jgi:hypothetical protein
VRVLVEQFEVERENREHTKCEKRERDCDGFALCRLRCGA